MSTAPWRWVALTCVLLGIAQPAFAEESASKTTRLIVPFPAGGGSDIVGRIVAQKLGDLTGQAVVVENRAGAGGSIGTEAAVKSAPDGYTLLLASTSEIAVNPSIYKLGYDPAKDLVPVALIASTPMVVVATPALPVRTMADVVKYVRDKPGEVNVGSAGNGSFTHLAGEYFRSMNNLKWTHVPYKGAPPALGDLAGGRIQLMFSTLPAAMGMIRSNLIKPIAVSAHARDPNLPDVPTVAESGIANYEVQYWYGLFVPAGTPKDVVARLADAIGRTLKSPEVVDGLAKQGATAGALTQAQFADYVTAEVDKWAKVVRESGAKID